MKKKVVLIGIILVLILIPIFLIILVKDDNMERKAYTNLGIVSTKKPFNTHLWWFHSTYGIVMVDSTNQTVLLHSTIARLLVDGNDWSVINLTDNTNSYKIQAGWLDGNDLWLVSCDNDGTADDFEVFFIELDDSNDCNPIGVSAGATANTVYAFDIFKIGTDHFVINKETRTGSLTLVVWDVDAAFVEKGTFVEDAGFTDNDGFYFGIVTGTKYYSFMSYNNAGGPILYVSYDNSIPSLTVPVVAGVAAHAATTDKNMRGVSYDGNDSLIFVGRQIADTKNYLITYTISTGASSIGAEYNIAIQTERSTAAGIPEKAFHITESSIYQLQTTITNQLHLIATPSTDAVWIAITDNFLMNDDGDMYEYEDINAYITELVINMKKMGHWTATMSQLDTYPIEKGMFVVIRGTFTTAANSPFLYRGTYNFKDDIVGSEPSEGTPNNSANCTTTIISELDGHKKVLQLFDNNNAGVAQITFTITQGLNTIIEFWCTKSAVGTSSTIYVDIRESGTQVIFLKFEDNDLDYYDGAYHSVKDNFLVANTLSHFKLILDDTANTYDVYIDDILEKADAAYWNNSTSGVNLVILSSDNTDGITGYYGYFDALGLSTDSDYNVGDNNYVAEGEDQIIFEGYVGPFTKRFIQDVQLVSPAKRDLDEEFPDGDYSGRTDQIIVLLLADHGDYITAGTMSAGMAMGTITFSGDKSLREIFDEFALQDNFIWSLNPVGVMTYNNGTTDSLILLNASSPISNVNKTFGERATNYVDIKGGFVEGAQVVGTPAQNIPDQQTNGRLPFEQTFSHLDLAAQCTTTNTNILSRLGTQPLIVPFTHKDSLIGVIQVGELVTFEYDLTDPNISRFQGLILDCIYDAKQGKANYRISDVVI